MIIKSMICNIIYTFSTIKMERRMEDVTWEMENVTWKMDDGYTATPNSALRIPHYPFFLIFL
jgi:hypothetical protein